MDIALTALGLLFLVAFWVASSRAIAAQRVRESAEELTSRAEQMKVLEASIAATTRAIESLLKSQERVLREVHDVRSTLQHGVPIVTVQTARGAHPRLEYAEDSRIEEVIRGIDFGQVVPEAAEETSR